MGPEEALEAAVKALDADLIGRVVTGQSGTATNPELALIVMDAVLPFIVGDARTIAQHQLMAVARSHRATWDKLGRDGAVAGNELLIARTYEKAAKLVGN